MALTAPTERAEIWAVPVIPAIVVPLLYAQIAAVNVWVATWCLAAN